MKRARSEREQNRLLGPAAAAMRKNQYTVFRDAREATEQVTTEKLLRDAAAMQKFHTPSSKAAQARLLIYSPEELALYRQKTRAEMETRVKRGYKFLGNWIKFARWEAQQKDFTRMRDVLQRAVGFHGDDPVLWRDYAELEAANGFVEEARAVWNRGVTALPASTDLWLKYLVFEQTAAAASGPASSSSLTGSLGHSGSRADAHDGANTVRDVFNRWLAVPTSAPAAAYELYALFETQQENKMGCRDVIRRYVEKYNNPEAWLFAAYTELNVFGDADRAVRVLTTALQALPDALLWGPLECRVPLALADVLTTCGKIAEARQQYRDLLVKISGGGGVVATTSDAVSGTSNPTSPTSAPPGNLALVDEVLAAYGRFERLHADAKSYEKLSRLEAQKVYERRLAANPADFDAWLSLYLLLREGEQEETAEAASGAASCEALACLSKALATPVKQLDRDPYAAQQRAVLVMEYARRCEAAGQIASAREALEQGIRSFPFELASCPRLWLEAAAFESRQGNFDAARTLLSAGAQKAREDVVAITSAASADGGGAPQDGSATTSAANESSRLLFQATLRLEEQAMERGLCSRDEYVSRVRASYQAPIRATPLDEKLWYGFAKFEEKEGQFARAQALYTACIRSLTAEACKTRSFTQRYALLALVDKTWARKLALQQKVIKKLKSKTTSGKEAAHAREVEALTQTVAAAEAELVTLYVDLLKGVWGDYAHEALAWRSAYLVNEAAAAELRRLNPKAPATEKEDKAPGSAIEGDEKSAQKQTEEAEEPEEANVEPDDSADGYVKIPAKLPEALGPARTRWVDAVKAVVDFIVGPPRYFARTHRGSRRGRQRTGGQHGHRGGFHAPTDAEATSDQRAIDEERRAYTAHVLQMREVLTAMLTDERAVLKRTLGWDNDTSFDAAQDLARWVTLLLSPLTEELAVFEAAYRGALGGASHRPTAAPAAVAPVVEEMPKRRTRLLRKRN